MKTREKDNPPRMFDDAETPTIKRNPMWERIDMTLLEWVICESQREILKVRASQNSTGKRLTAVTQDAHERENELMRYLWGARSVYSERAGL